MLLGILSLGQGVVHFCCPKLWPSDGWKKPIMKGGTRPAGADERSVPPSGRKVFGVQACQW